MDRREFAKVMGAVAAGLAAGTRVFAADAKPDDKAPKHICKSHNECKGKGGCKTDKNACAGKNDCKGKGGCAVPVKAEHLGKPEDKAKHACGGKSGCPGKDEKKK